jgi:30S ribosomal protein S31
MGRGDKRSRRGKIFKGSYGNTRSHKVEGAKVTKSPAAAAKKPATKKK